MRFASSLGMPQSLMDAIGFVMVIFALFGFLIWLGAYFLYETGRRIFFGKSAQERSLDEFQRLRSEEEATLRPGVKKGRAA